MSAQSVSVDVNGVVTPDTLTFTYKAKEAVSAKLHIAYIDAETNTEIYGEDRELEAGEYTITPDASKLNGYELADAESVQVTVLPDGTASQGTVAFNVVRVKASAPVTFEYVSASGKAVSSPLTATLTEGQIPTAEYAAVVEGYTLKSVSAETVTVSADGKADPSIVTFTYEENTTTARVEVHYVNSFGADLAGSPVIQELPVGEHTIAPDASAVPAGYVLSGSAAAQKVSVGSDLVAYPNSISFTCYEATVTGSITINYYDSTTNSLITNEVRSLSPGTYTIEPDETLVAQKGKYEKSDVMTNTTVEVKETGTTVPSVINFYYKPAEIDIYQGYVLVTRQTSMRSTAATNGAVVQTLPVNTLLYVAGQYESGSVTWHSAQTVLGDSVSGWVNDADVRRISATEAQALIEEYNQQQTSSTPVQNAGYYITVYDGVPMRTYTNFYAEIKGYLKNGTVVYVFGQEYDGSQNTWHQATYDGVSGYIADGQIRKLTSTEVQQYLAQGGTTTTPTNTGSTQYDPNGLSSYGYVSAGSVNFRSGASLTSTRLKTLNRYAMALILGTKEVDGVTWYNVNYNGTTGWIHGSYFHQMTMSEFNSFLNSEQYTQGITNNQATTATTSASTGSSVTGGSTGSATQGSVTSVEDWNVGTWQNTGVAPQTSYEPFNPYATPSATVSPQGLYTTTSAEVKFYETASESAEYTTLPEDATLTVSSQMTVDGKDWYSVTYDGKTGYVEADADISKVTASESPEPTATFVIGTMIPIDYEDESKETETGSVPWGLIGGAVVLIGGAGGVYAYALNQNKRRMAAARAAASKRTGAAGAAAGAAATTKRNGTNNGTGSTATSPYARRAVAAPPAAGTARDGRPTQTTATTQGYGTVPNPYSGGSITGASQSGMAQGAPYTGPYGTAGTNPYGESNPFAGSTDGYTGTKPADGLTGSAGSEADNPFARPRTAEGGSTTGMSSPDTPAETANPFAAPRTAEGGSTTGMSSPDTPAETANPFAAPRTAEGGSTTGMSSPDTPAETANPFARPITPPSAQTDTQATQSGIENAVRRRATRMERYHAAEDGTDDNA